MATKKRPGGKAPEGRGMEKIHPGGHQDAHHRIATAAYFKAESRGFVPGREVEDWLEAEAELLAQERV